MATVAGKSRPLVRLSSTVKDKALADALRVIEDKIEELDTRLFDAERRLKAGGH